MPSNVSPVTEQKGRPGGAPPPTGVPTNDLYPSADVPPRRPITAADRAELAKLVQLARSLQSGVPGNPAGPFYGDTYAATSTRISQIMEAWAKLRAPYHPYGSPTLFAGQPRVSDPYDDMDAAVSLLDSSANYGPAALADAAAALERRARALQARTGG